MDSAPSIWPMDDLRLTHPDLSLRAMRESDLPHLTTVQPKDHEHDPRIAAFSFHDRLQHRVRLVQQEYWRARATWTPDAWRLDLVAVVAGQIVGVQSLEADHFPSLRTVDTHSWLIEAVRGRGLGVAMRVAALTLAFDHLGARAAVSSARSDNAASLGVSIRCGYSDNGVSLTTSEHGPAELRHVRLSRQQWRTGRHPEVEVIGVDRCLPWFGAEPTAVRSGATW